MPDRIVSVDGKRYKVPENATLDEIQAYIDGPAKPAPDVKPVASHAESNEQRFGRLFPQATAPLEPMSWKMLGRALPVAASGMAAEATGGLSLLPRLLAQGVAGVASGAGRSALEGDTSQSGMGKRAAVDAATNVLPGVVGAGLRKVAPAVMEGALRINAPLARKFGAENLGTTALAHRIVPTAKGAEKAGNIVGNLMDEKQALLAAAGQRASMVPGTITAAALQEVDPQIARELRAGAGPQVNPPLAKGFLEQNPRGLTPAELDDVKRVWDDMSNADRTRMRIQGGRLGAEEMMPIALAKSAKAGLEEVAPGYSALNQQIRDVKGVQLAALGRANIPARGLDNLATTYGVTEALAAGKPFTALALGGTRLLRVPQNMGRAAIGADALGKALLKPGAAPTAEAVRAAIIALLNQQGQQP
jgi:hypothetical protein